MPNIPQVTTQALQTREPMSTAAEPGRGVTNGHELIIADRPPFEAVTNRKDALRPSYNADRVRGSPAHDHASEHRPGLSMPRRRNQVRSNHADSISAAVSVQRGIQSGLASLTPDNPKHICQRDAHYGRSEHCCGEAIGRMLQRSVQIGRYSKTLTPTRMRTSQDH